MISAHDARAVAVAAECDDRTVVRRVSGQTVKAISAQRVDRALRALGWSPVYGAEGTITGWARTVGA